MAIVPHEVRTEFAKRVEAAFEDVPYPGDDNICDAESTPDETEIIRAFRGKHWKAVNFEFIMFRFTSALYFLSSEAFVIYLPSYLITTIVHYENCDVLPDYMWGNLAVEENDAFFREVFLPRAKLLTTKQIEIIEEFLDLMYLQMEKEFSEEIESANEVISAKRFWRVYRQHKKL
jgi:hypothetical protein